MKKKNRGKILQYYWKNTKYEYLEFPYFRYYRSKFTTHGEKKNWFNYLDELKDNGLTLHSVRRNHRNIPNEWDDYKNSTKNHHVRDWKKHYKCKKQWMKNLKNR